MWEFLLRQILRHELKQGAEKAIPNDPFSLTPEPTNERETYVGRIKKDFHIDDYYDALELYNSDPAYWQRYYQPPPSPELSRERIRDSAAAAGIPSRYNVWEYDYPEGTTNPVAPQSRPNQPASPTDKRSEVPGGAQPTAFTPTGASNAPRPRFPQLLNTGNFAGVDPNSPANAWSPPLQASQTATPLQADPTQADVDNRFTRFLVGRSYDPSQVSPFAGRPAPLQPSPDGSLSLNDAYLEYLKRLNGV